MSNTPLGRFCWYELMTTDPGAAPDFYTAIAGWGTMPFDGAPEPYTMWVNGEQPIGGLMQLPPEAAKGGAPPHWMVHISTPALADTTARAKKLGGDVVMQMDVPTVGTFAVIKDPQGAYFAAYQPSGDAPGTDEAPAVGQFSWHELATDDWKGAWSFYSELFGWTQTDQMDMGDMGIYHMFGRGAHPLGGMFNRPPAMPMSAWLFYIRVPDVDAAVAKVNDLGGRVLNGPMEVPGGSMIAQCMDPQGAAFALQSNPAG